MLSESGCLADIDIEVFNWFLIFWKSLLLNTPYQRTNYGMERTTDVWMIEKYSCWCFCYGSFIVAFKNGNEFKPAFRFDRKLEAGEGWRLLRSRNSSHNRYKSLPLSLPLSCCIVTFLWNVVGFKPLGHIHRKRTQCWLPCEVYT